MRFLQVFSVLLCLASLAQAAPVSTSKKVTLTNSAAVVVPPELPVFIIMCHEDVDVDALLEEFQITPTFRYPIINGFAAPIEAVTVERLKEDPRISSVEEDGPVSFASQNLGHGVVRMGLPQFPIARINGISEPLDVGVAIIDSGINVHEDLTVAHFWSPITFDPSDELGHGTTVARVVAAHDNEKGMVGVAPGVRIWSVKIMSRTSNAWVNYLAGLNYIWENADKISVANLSWGNEGTTAPISSIRLGVRRMVQSGIVVVAAAGNKHHDLAGPDGIYSTGDDVIPAAFAEVMAVSGVDTTIDSETGESKDQFWVTTPGVFGSNFSAVERPIPTNPDPTVVYPVSPGGAIDVAAPAVNIWTTAPNGSYGYGTGTSYAAPHVAGLVALYIAANGRAYDEKGVYKIRQAIIDSALPQSQWNSTNTLDTDGKPEPMAIFSEAWLPRTAITNISGVSGGISIKFPTFPGYDYEVETTSDLTPPVSWTNAAVVNTSGNSNVVAASVTDTNAASQNFYRLNRTQRVKPPEFVMQPLSWLKQTGEFFTLQAAAIGTPVVGLQSSSLFWNPSLAYQWYKNGVPLVDDANVSGATTQRLRVTNAEPSHAGNYFVVVTNDYGNATSTVATVTFETDPDSTLVNGVQATATSGITGRHASNAVNGIYHDPNPWQSVGVNEGYGTDISPAITFDLQTVRPLEKVTVWNSHETGPSVKRMRIEENGAGQIFPAFTVTASCFAALHEVEFHEYLEN